MLIMGYNKIIQYGDTVELYEYNKELHPKRKAGVSRIQKRRLKDRRSLKTPRSKRSIYRSKVNFYRLCYHNNAHASSIHFLTITYAYDIDLKQASRYVAHFFQRIKQRNKTVSFSYISVPELTKKGRYHFHCLVYDLPPQVAGDPISIWHYNRRKRAYEWQYATTERFTRNLQRLFRHGYIDISPTTYASAGLAGYMAKYMGKSLTDDKSQASRGYTSSRNIKKIGTYGINKNSFRDHIAFYADVDVDKDYGFTHQLEYDTQYMGRCVKSVYKKIN